MPRITWKLLSIAIFIVLMVALEGCADSGTKVVNGSGKVETKREPAVDVRHVNYSAPGKLTVVLGDKEELAIKAEDNLIPLVDIEIVGDTLSIFLSEGTSLAPTKPIEFTLTVKKLNGAELTGSGDVFVPDLVGEQLFMTLTGSGDFRSGDLKADLVQVESEGSGMFELGTIEADWLKLLMRSSGGVEVRKVEATTLQGAIGGSGGINIAGGEVLGQTLTLGGSGKYKAKSLRATNAQVELTGSGSATLRAKDNLIVHLSGSGNILYYGEPEVSESVKGSGKIKKQD